MDSSDLTDKDLDYERTIARARRHSCTLLFLHIVMAVSPLLIIIFTGKFIAIVPLGLVPFGLRRMLSEALWMFGSSTRSISSGRLFSSL